MVETESLILVLLGVQAVLLVIAACRSDAQWLKQYIMTNLLLVTLFSAVLMSIAGYVTNVASVLYSAVLVAQITMIERYGVAAARDAIFAAIFQIVAIIAIVFTMPLLEQSSGIGEATMDLVQQHPRRAMASLMAFWLSQMLLLIVYCFLVLRNVSFLTRGAIAVIVCQAVDSAFFYPVAFLGKLSLDQVWLITVTGFVAKVATGLMLLPVVQGILWYFGSRSASNCAEVPNRL